MKNNKKTITYFQKYLQYVDKNLNRKMSQEDGHKISTFHQAGYTDEFEQAAHQIEKDLKQFNSFVQNLNHYNKSLFNTIKQHEEKVRVAGNNLNTKHKKLKADVSVLKNNVSLSYKLKIFVEINFGNKLK